MIICHSKVNQTWIQLNVSKKERFHEKEGLSHEIPVKQLRRIKTMNYCVSEKEIIIIKAHLW